MTYISWFSDFALYLEYYLLDKCLEYYLLDKCLGVVGWCEGVMYLVSPGRPTDIGLQFGKACYRCSR